MTLETIHEIGTGLAALFALGFVVAAYVRRSDPYLPWWLLLAVAGLFAADVALRLIGWDWTGTAVLWGGVLVLFIWARVMKRNTRRLRAETARLREQNERTGRELMDRADRVRRRIEAAGP